MCDIKIIKQLAAEREFFNTAVQAQTPEALIRRAEGCERLAHIVTRHAFRRRALDFAAYYRAEAMARLRN